jgi:hopene-associated glycosyltransferase HpnB
VLVAAALCALIWLGLLLGRGGFWRADVRLPAADAAGLRDWPAVAVITPARNEAGTIAASASAHLRSDYRGALSVTVVDDQSADATADEARSAGAGAAREVRVIAGAPLPPGWTGKLWALQQGVEAVAPSAPPWLLFVDADIVLAPDALSRLVALAERRGLALASLMARLDASGAWGRLLIPAFVFFFQKLYPFPLSNRADRDEAAAAGGCVLVRREALEAAGGLAAMRGALIDDCTLAGRIKGVRGEGPRRPVWLGLADDEALSLRSNRRLGTIWRMVARTAFVQLRRSWLLLAGCVGGMAATYIAGPLALLAWPWHGDAAAAALGALAWALMSLAYLPTVRLYDGGLARALTLPLAALLYTAMTVDSARRDLMGRGGAWKGRTYPAG